MKTIHRTGHGLLSLVLAIGLATQTRANSITATDPSWQVFDLSPSSIIGVNTGSGTGPGFVSVNVNTQSLSGGVSSIFDPFGHGILLQGGGNFDANVNLAPGFSVGGGIRIGTGYNKSTNIDGSVSGGIFVDGSPSPGNIAVGGVGQISGGVTIDSDAANTTINGLNGGVNGPILVTPNGMAQNIKNGDVSISLAGPVVGAGYGIRVDQVQNPAGCGSISIDAKDVSLNWNSAIEAFNCNAITNIVARGNTTSNAGGIMAGPTTADTVVSGANTGVVSGNFYGVLAGQNYLGTTPTGNVTIEKFNAVNGGDWSLVASSNGGAIVIKDNGPISSLPPAIGPDSSGIQANNTTGPISIQNNGPINVATTGMVVQGVSASISIVSNKDVKTAAGDGIKVSSTGPISILSNDPIDAAITGMVVQGGAAPINIVSNKSIKGTVGDGIKVSSGTGTIHIHSNGNIDAKNNAVEGISPLSTADVIVDGNGDINSTHGNGVTAITNGGHIRVGTGVRNGKIFGRFRGIYAKNTTNRIMVTVDKDVDSSVIGIDTTTTTGPQFITILPTAKIGGGNVVVAMSTTTGVARLANQGTIQPNGDTGATTNPGHHAIDVRGHAQILNYRGIFGGVTSSGSTMKFVNYAGNTWIPRAGMSGPFSGNTFNAISDFYENRGKTVIRNGLTEFKGLEFFRNAAGGSLEFWHSPGGDETLLVQHFRSDNNSEFKINVDFAAPYGSGDSTSLGTGNADTLEIIPGGVVQAIGLTKFHMLFSGKTIAQLAGTSGSIALIKSNASPLPDPGVNGGASLTQSANYVFLTNPSTALTKFVLQDDGAGGVYLRWANP